MSKRKNALRDTMGDKIFYVINGFFLLLLALIIIYPLYFIIIASISDPDAVLGGEVILYPVRITFEGFAKIMERGDVWRGYLNTIIYTLLTVVLSLIVTIPAGWALSRKTLPGKKGFMIYFIIPMFFGGGLIPTYLLISRLGMLDTIWAIVLPGAFSVWNMIIARTYYQGIPKELREAASVDGANDIVYFFKIMMPVCKPVIMVLVLWQFVGMWNSYFDAMIYLSSESRQPLQLVLRAILIQSQPQPGMVSDIQSTAARAQLAELLKYATIIISSIPLLIMYPFFQKYFDSGVMVGSVKG